MQVLEIKGELEAAAAQQALEAGMPQFEKCYGDARARGVKLPAMLGLRVTLSSEGKVTRVEWTGNGRPDATLAKCLTEAVQGITFPKPASGEVELTVQFSLSG